MSKPDVIAGLEQVDPDIHRLIEAETIRQRDSVRLIASENYVSQAVLQATGSVLTNKYSEGYPGRRYYEGNQHIDAVERIAQDRAKALFGAEHANVQPYSGSPANLAVYFGLLEPGDTVMGLSLPHGGHLTHGWKVSFSGRLFRSVPYEINKETGRIEMEEVRQQALRERPRMIIAGATAYPRLFDFAAFADIAKEVGAYFLADIAHIAGLVVGGVHPSPVPHADAVTTTTHKTLRGPRGAMILCKAEHKKALDRAVFPALQGGPHNHTTAAIAVALQEASQPAFAQYAAQVVKNSQAFAARLMEHGFELVTGGSDNHLVLVDLTSKGIAGKPLAQALDRAGIVVNYNSVPHDPRRPFDPSGIRMGAAAVTTRGFREDDMAWIADQIAAVADHLEDEAFLERSAEDVKARCSDFLVPGVGV